MVLAAIEYAQDRDQAALVIDLERDRSPLSKRNDPEPRP